MVNQVLVSDKASQDLQKILSWYDQHSEEAAHRFLKEVDHSIKKIALSPSLYKIVAPGIQRCLLKIFPHIIYFSQLQETIIILRFRHKKQKRLKRFK